MDDALRAWLGPALDDLTAEQLARIEAEDKRITARYPDPDDMAKASAALSAAVQYLLGEKTVEDAGRALLAAREAEALAYVAAQQIAAMAADDGMPEIRAAFVANVAKNSVRKARGLL
jgi:hypothetical protein